MRPLVRRAAFALLLLAWCCGTVSVSFAGDWFRADSPLELYDPFKPQIPRWIRLSVQAGDYRAEVEQDGSASVVRAIAIMPSILLTAPTTNFRPYIGAGVGLSISEMMPDSLRPVWVPMQLEESFVMHISGGLSYRLSPHLTLTSSARFAQFKTSDLVGRIAPPNLPLGSEGLDFSTYSVNLGIQVNY
jgi:opacity protein-like surface antigen